MEPEFPGEEEPKTLSLRSSKPTRHSPARPLGEGTTDPSPIFQKRDLRPEMGSGLPEPGRAEAVIWHPLVTPGCLRMDPDVGNLAPAGREFEGMLDAPKDGDGARLALSGTPYVNGLCPPNSPADSRSLSLFIHPQVSDTISLCTPRPRGALRCLRAALQRVKARFSAAFATWQSPQPGKPPVLRSLPGHVACDPLHTVLYWLLVDLM